MTETIISPTGKILRYVATMITTPQSDNTVKEVRIDMSTGRFVTAAGGQKIADVAKNWWRADVPYVTGGKTKKGADCSGSVWAIYNEAGLSYGAYTNTAGFTNIVGTDSNFLKGKHYFKKVGAPQVGDVGVWSNGKSGNDARGHMAIYDTGAGKTKKGLVGNLWSATHPGGDKFGPSRIDFFDHMSGYGSVTWYRYWKAQ